MRARRNGCGATGSGAPLAKGPRSDLPPQERVLLHIGALAREATRHRYYLHGVQYLGGLPWRSQS